MIAIRVCFGDEQNSVLLFFSPRLYNGIAGVLLAEDCVVLRRLCFGDGDEQEV